LTRLARFSLDTLSLPGTVAGVVLGGEPAWFREYGKKVMANRAIWSVRKRHEWLATPLKKKRIKRAARIRCGLQDALDRKATQEPVKAEA